MKIFLFLMIYAGGGYNVTKYEMPNMKVCHVAVNEMLYTKDQSVIAFCSGPKVKKQ